MKSTPKKFILVALLILLFLPFPTLGWFWEKPDISKISVDFYLSENLADVGDCEPAEPGATKYSACQWTLLNGGLMYAKLKNNTEYYIKSIKAKCIGFDKNKNRVLNKELSFLKKTSSNEELEITPGNSAVLSSPISYVKSFECQIIEADGSKK